MTLSNYLQSQARWSIKTFGIGRRTKGICKHIQKELLEIQQQPENTDEWIDVIILGLDGYWRAGGTPESIMKDLQTKQNINFLREYPFPTSEDEPSEHNRTEEIIGYESIIQSIWRKFQKRNR